MDVNDIMKLLPHRFPFLMIDRIISVDETKCTGMKQLTYNEHFFQGHFPGHPVMPGVLQLEAMAQVGSVLLLRKPGYAGKIGYFMSADAVKFRKPVVPGDTLFIEVEMTANKRAIAKARGRCIVNNEVVSEAEMLFGVVDA
jgi:UDP-3-O-[3-hydroxymyristoyl] N-acetylglucosamine deacetylase/3-hydroxyacyl-[acyl-carrier-protein] dehydratase